MKELENASARVHISRLEAIKLQVQHEMERLYGNCNDAIDRHIRDIYTHDYYHTAYEIQKNTGIGCTMHQFDTRVLDKVIAKPWAADGKNFSERLWGNKTKLINTLHKELTRMLIMGEAPDKAINNIARKMKSSKEQAG